MQATIRPAKQYNRFPGAKRDQGPPENHRKEESQGPRQSRAGASLDQDSQTVTASWVLHPHLFTIV